jgi:hypothetical protein
VKIPRAIVVLAFAAVVTAAHAHGDVRCDKIAKSEWRSQDDLRKQLVAEGSTVRRIKVENGCYEVYGLDSKGQKFENFYHPKTLERVEAKKP